MIESDGAPISEVSVNGQRYIFIENEYVQHCETQQIGLVQEIAYQPVSKNGAQFAEKKALVLWGISDNKHYESWERLSQLQAVKEGEVRVDIEGEQQGEGNE